jgi:tetratricopeptide (TPR) repeat protein
MSAIAITADARCDLIRLERTNMVTKLEDRIKIDLVSLSNLILDHLKLCEPGSLSSTPAMISELAVQFNQGALLQYQYGAIERAEVLCRGEIELFGQLSSFSPHRVLCQANMIAPYINLARIYGQKGEVRESLGIFEEIYRFATGQQDLSIFTHRIPVADAAAIVEAIPGLQRVMLSCRVVEAARVLQTVEDYDALLELVETNASLPQFQDAFFRQYLLEIRSRALLHVGEHELALKTFEECCDRMPLNTTDRVVAHLLLSQIYREWGRNDAAASILDKLADHLASLEKFGKRLPILRQIAYRLALERHALGDNAGAIEPAKKSFNWCGELSDQPGSIKNAILLLRVSSNGTRNDYWHNELQRLAAATLFKLERACAYWELGGEFLQHSYDLYRSVPFVDSKQSSETVAFLLRQLPTRNTFSSRMEDAASASIDAVFDALMEYVPA